jgi:uncharacterized zinc-type alcohol dehydrogenase-like protein
MDQHHRKNHISRRKTETRRKISFYGYSQFFSPLLRANKSISTQRIHGSRSNLQYQLHQRSHHFITMPPAIPDEIQAMGFAEAKADPSPLTYSVKPLAATDADIVITYNGVCHSDVHMIDNDWGMSVYPLVPGHEIVGHVINVGSAVTNLKVGDAVCLGCVAQSCLTCDQCESGVDNLCASKTLTYMGNTSDETGEHRHYGGFGSYMRTDARKLFVVPEGLEEKYVGPLMCAGVTVFEPLHHALGDSLDATGKTIGVMGIGGLGHLALQYASKMGATTVAFSRGTSKTDFAKELGATSLVDTTSEEAFAGAAGTLDILLITTAGGFVDIGNLMSLMKPYGIIHLCGVPGEDLKFNAFGLIQNRLTVSGSLVGGKVDSALMLKFSAENGIKPIIEEFPHSHAKEALEKVRDGSIRFRAVLKNDLV